jgi:hypothetical protein
MATQSVRIGWRPYVNQAASNLLDSYSGAAAAYSLRKLRSSYSGSAIRVRRSSDNTELNIGFDSDGNLDTISLSSFVGSGNGFVTTWYDQSGSLRDITQSTAANQPKIVNAGSIYRLNGLPSVYFYDNFLFSSLLTMPINNVTNTTVSSSFTTDSLGWGGVNYQSVLSFGGLSDYIGYATYYTYSNSQFEFNSESRFSNWNGQKTSTSLNKVNLSFNYHGYTQILSWLNSNSFGSSTFVNTNLSTQQYLTVGSRWHGSGFYFHLRGYVSEAIIWNNDKTSNRTQIESNINSFYSIYPNPSSVWNLLTASYNADAVGSSSLKTSLVSVYNGESNANDSKGTNNGTAQGGLTYTTGKIGNAFNFNGSNAYVGLPNNSLNFTSDFSISLWVYLTAFPGEQIPIGNYYESSPSAGNSRGWMIYMTGQNLYWIVCGSSQVNLITSISSFQNTWKQITITFKNGVGSKIYFDGNLVTSNSSTISPIYNSTQTPFIGKYQYGNGSSFGYMSANSKIDAVNIYQKELTASEVIELYNSGNGAQYIGDNFYKPTTNDALNTNNGTAVGGLTYGLGKVGTAFVFNGTTSYVRFPDNAFNSLTGSFSVSAWFKTSSSILNVSNYILNNISANTWFNNGNGFDVQQYGNVLNFTIFNNTNTETVLGANYTFSTNTWYHVTATKLANGNMNLYLNGSLVGTKVTSVNPTYLATVSKPCIGALNIPARGSVGYFAQNGFMVDALNIWTKELTQADVTELYNSGNGKQYPN